MIYTGIPTEATAKPSPRASSTGHPSFLGAESLGSKLRKFIENGKFELSDIDISVCKFYKKLNIPFLDKRYDELYLYSYEESLHSL